MVDNPPKVGYAKPNQPTSPTEKRVGDLDEKFDQADAFRTALKIAKREIEALKSQLASKERGMTTYREENVKLKKENSELKREILQLKAAANRTSQQNSNGTENNNNQEREGGLRVITNDREQAREMRDNFRQI